MAGGKETPRQKLIGLMYLVLLALLALQVSSAIMEKFIFLDDSIKHANEISHKNNNDIALSIKKTVEAEGNKDKDVLTMAEKVRKEAEEILATIAQVRKEMIEKTGGINEAGEYIGAKEETKIEEIMIGGPNKNGKGYVLKKELNAFSADLNSILKQLAPKLGKDTKLPELEDLALDGKDDPMFAKKPEQKRKDFVELNFAQTPLVAALAVLSTKEAQVLKHEADALNIIASAVGAENLKFDQIEAMYRADSRVVAAGTKYKAELFMAASSSTLKPDMSLDGRPLKVENGKGMIEFMATAGAYDAEGNAKKTWEGKITIKNKGKDTTFTVKGEYVVAKPVIQVQAGAVSALYRNCGNELNVQVPALGSEYQPSFSATGARVIPGSKKGMVTVVPDAPKVDLRVSSGGNLIGVESFNVRLLPKPTVEALDRGKPVDEKRGVNAPGPTSIKMAAIAEDGIKQFLPNDARYKVAEWDATLVRGKRPVASQTFRSEMGDFNEIRSKAQPGDRIVIEVKSVKRMNFRGEIEDVNLGTIIKNIPINDPK